MINANVFLWVFAGLFALSGWMRGWQREIIATASLVLAIFALNFANQGDRLVNFVQRRNRVNPIPSCAATRTTSTRATG